MYGNCLAGFHRLAINDTSDKGDQPFELNEEFLMCNGEIYNYDELQSQHNFPLNSKSDCEILLHMFQMHGIDKALSMIDGVFAIVYVTKTNIHMIRDRVGVKPLFYSLSFDSQSLLIGSEPILLDGIHDDIKEVLPSTYTSFSKDGNYINTTTYFTFPDTPSDLDEENAIIQIKEKLINSVKKRLCTDRPIGCLLSGGLDSSLIASILSKELRDMSCERECSSERRETDS
jgi:asparagine synthase (glutamine-hydrolysing)